MAGRLDTEGGDVLFIGTSTDLHAYDVDKNRDVFYKDVCEGYCCFDRAMPIDLWAFCSERIEFESWMMMLM